MFDADRCLHVHRGPEVRCDGIGGRCRLACGLRGCGCSNVRRGILHYILLLIDAILANRLQHVGVLEAVEEPAVATTNDRLCRFALAINSPGKGETWSEVSVVVDPVLSLIADSIAQREVRTHSPIVLVENTAVN